MKKLLPLIFIVFLAGGLYTATIRGVAGNPSADTIKATLDGAAKPFELSPERGRFAHVMTLAETGQYALTKQLANFVYPDVGYYKGNFYSYFAPGISYMSLPLYLLGAQFGLAQVATFAFVSLCSILALIFLYKICTDIFRMPVWASLASVIIFAFGSTAWSYAITLYQHHVTTFLILSAFYSVWKFKRQGKFSFLWASWVWLAYAIALFIDYPNALLMAPVMVYFFLSAWNLTHTEDRLKLTLRWSFVLASVFFIAVTFLHAYHNATYFGSAKRLAGSVVGYRTLEENNLLGQDPAVIEEKLAARQAEKDNVVGFFREERVPTSPYILLFSRDRGLFIYAPIFIFAIFGLYSMLKNKNMEVAILLALVLVNLFVYGSWGDPWGGWAYGTRYLIVSMSILAIAIGYWLANSVRHTWLKKSLVALFFVYSSAIALLGALTTNAVPPKVEADFLNLKYNFLYNLDFLRAGRSGSFLYNTYLRDSLSLLDYYLALYVIVLAVFWVVLVVMPSFERKKHD